MEKGLKPKVVVAIGVLVVLVVLVVWWWMMMFKFLIEQYPDFYLKSPKLGNTVVQQSPYFHNNPKGGYYVTPIIRI